MNNKEKIRKALDIFGFCCNILTLICVNILITLKIKKWLS